MNTGPNVSEDIFQVWLCFKEESKVTSSWQNMTCLWLVVILPKCSPGTWDICLLCIIYVVFCGILSYKLAFVDNCMFFVRSSEELSFQPISKQACWTTGIFSRNGKHITQWRVIVLVETGERGRQYIWQWWHTYSSQTGPVKYLFALCMDYTLNSMKN